MHPPPPTEAREIGADQAAGLVIRCAGQTPSREVRQRMEHVGIVVDDLAASIEFFLQLGLELQGEGSVEGRWVDRIVELEGVHVEFATMQTPDGHGRLELV